MKSTNFTLILVLLIICVVIIYYAGLIPRNAGTAISVTSTGPTITQLEKMGELVSLRVSVADVMKVSDGGYSGAWVVKGECLISVDLRGSKIISKNESSRKCVIALPNPKVLMARIDHQKTSNFSIVSISWWPWNGDRDQLHEIAMKEAENLITFAASTAEYRDQARDQASHLIKNFYSLMDWEVEIEWAEALPETEQEK